MPNDFKRFRDDITTVLTRYYRDIITYHLRFCDSPEMFKSRVSKDIENEEKANDIARDVGIINDAEYELIRDCLLIIRVNLSLLTYEFQRNALNIQPKDMWDMYTNIFER